MTGLAASLALTLTGYGGGGGGSSSGDGDSVGAVDIKGMTPTQAKNALGYDTLSVDGSFFVDNFEGYLQAAFNVDSDAGELGGTFVSLFANTAGGVSSDVVDRVFDALGFDLFPSISARSGSIVFDFNDSTSMIKEFSHVNPEIETFQINPIVVSDDNNSEWISSLVDFMGGDAQLQL